MFFKTNLIFILTFIALIFFTSLESYSQESTIEDQNFKFKFTLPGTWVKKDSKQTKDLDGISYTFETKDKKMAIMILAFKLSSVKNLDDFIYNMEKDISLNIPSKSGDYTEQDFGKYDVKSAIYKDTKYEEMIYYFRTKLPDAPNNYVYMVRFITEIKDYTSDTESQFKLIAGTFTPTAE